jgi:DNA-binding GntR family transcriptional regulator
MNKRKGFQSSDVYGEIRRRILTLELKPGEIIDEKKLRSELKVGKTPFREAVLTLKNENLIVSLPNRSSYVKELTLMDGKDLLESLLGIEKLVSTLAIQRITPDKIEEIEKMEKKINEAIKRQDFAKIESENLRFHQLIAEGSNNQYLSSIYDHLRSKVSRLSYLAFNKEFENKENLKIHFAKVIDQHREMIVCLKKKDAQRMEELIVGHTKLLQARIVFCLMNLSL